MSGFLYDFNMYEGKKAKRNIQVILEYLFKLLKSVVVIIFRGGPRRSM